MRLFKSFMAITIIAAISGCSAFNISRQTENATESVGGVPFFVKKEAVRQTTAYSVTWLEANLSLCDTAEKDGQKKLENCLSGTVPLSEGNVDPVKLAEAQSAAQTASNLEAAIGAFKKPLDGNAVLSSLEILEGTRTDKIQKDHGKLPAIMVSNTCEESAVVDYSTKYYFNAKAPLFGNADANFKTSEDGTFSEASSKIESGKLADVLPIEEAVSKAIGLNLKGVGFAQEEKQTRTLLIKYGSKGYIYTLTKTGDVGKVDCRTPLWYGGEGVSVVRKATGGGNSEPPTAENNGDGITFNGSVKLPKQK